MRGIGLLLAAAIFSQSSFALEAPGVWGGWTSSDGKYLYAGVENESHSRLVKSCDKASGKCWWFYGVQLACDESHKQIVLASGRLGSAAFKLTCAGKIEASTPGVQLYALAVDEDPDFERMVLAGGVVGLVIATEAGEFNVSRFNCDGAGTSIKALSTAIGASNLRKPTGLGDSSL